MSFDKNFYRTSPGSFSLPIIASEFLDLAIQQKKILKHFLDNGENIKPKDLISKKFKKKLHISKTKPITEDILVNNLIDKEYIPEKQEHPRSSVMDLTHLPIQSSTGESDFEAHKAKRIRNNKRFALKGLDDVTLEFHRDNTDDDLPSVRKRKESKIISSEIELEMNERYLKSFLRWKEKWCINILLCQELTYQDFADESKTERKWHKFYENGIEAVLSIMDTTDMDRNFINFVTQLEGDTNMARIAINNVENIREEYFNKYPKTPNYGTVFTDKDKVLNKRYIDTYLQRDIYLSNNLILSEYRKKLKYYNFQEEFLQKTYPEIKTNVPDDFIVTVTFYRPMMNKWKRPNYPRRTVHFVEEKKYLFRGENTILDLRDTILCSWDLVTTKLASNDFLQMDDCFGFLIPSSFIFIHDTFYVDMCRPNAQNLAERVKQFYDKRPQCLSEPLKIKSMLDTKIKDLTFRLNCPNVFVHMGGNCEHTFSFNDLKIMSSNDYLDLEIYPIIRFELVKHRRCNYCKKSPPCFIIVEDNITPKLPALCCQVCFDYLFADKQGVLKKNVIAYHYVDKINHQC